MQYFKKEVGGSDKAGLGTFRGTFRGSTDAKEYQHAINKSLEYTQLIMELHAPFMHLRDYSISSYPIGDVRSIDLNHKDITHALRLLEAGAVYMPEYKKRREREDAEFPRGLDIEVLFNMLIQEEEALKNPLISKSLPLSKEYKNNIDIIIRQLKKRGYDCSLLGNRAALARERCRDSCTNLEDISTQLLEGGSNPALQKSFTQTLQKVLNDLDALPGFNFQQTLPKTFKVITDTGTTFLESRAQDLLGDLVIPQNTPKNIIQFLLDHAADKQRLASSPAPDLLTQFELDRIKHGIETESAKLTDEQIESFLRSERFQARGWEDRILYQPSNMPRKFEEPPPIELNATEVYLVVKMIRYMIPKTNAAYNKFCELRVMDLHSGEFAAYQKARDILNNLMYLLRYHRTYRPQGPGEKEGVLYRYEVEKLTPFEALMHAVLQENYPVIAELYRQHPKLKTAFEQQEQIDGVLVSNSPVLLALQKQHSPMVEFLLEQGATAGDDPTYHDALDAFLRRSCNSGSESESILPLSPERIAHNREEINKIMLALVKDKNCSIHKNLPLIKKRMLLFTDPALIDILREPVLENIRAGLAGELDIDAIKLNLTTAIKLGSADLCMAVFKQMADKLGCTTDTLHTTKLSALQFEYMPDPEMTPIAFAIVCGRLDLVQLIYDDYVKQGINTPVARTRYSRYFEDTLMDYAILHNQHNVIKFLFSKGLRPSTAMAIVCGSAVDPIYWRPIEPSTMRLVTGLVEGELKLERKESAPLIQSNPEVSQEERLEQLQSSSRFFKSSTIVSKEKPDTKKSNPPKPTSS